MMHRRSPTCCRIRGSETREKDSRIFDHHFYSGHFPIDQFGRLCRLYREGQPAHGYDVRTVEHSSFWSRAHGCGRIAEENMKKNPAAPCTGAERRLLSSTIGGKRH